MNGNETHVITAVEFTTGNVNWGSAIMWNCRHLHLDSDNDVNMEQCKCHSLHHWRCAAVWARHGSSSLPSPRFFQLVIAEQVIWFCFLCIMLLPNVHGKSFNLASLIVRVRQFRFHITLSRFSLLLLFTPFLFSFFSLLGSYLSLLHSYFFLFNCHLSTFCLPFWLPLFFNTWFK